MRQKEGSVGPVHGLIEALLWEIRLERGSIASIEGRFGSFREMLKSTIVVGWIGEHVAFLLVFIDDWIDIFITS
jgi:hypothetical protein